MNDIQSLREPVRVPPSLAAPDESLAALPVADERFSGGGGIPILTQYLRIVLRWKWVILGCVVAALVAGTIITLLTTPLYTATASIEISRESDRVTKLEGVQSETASQDLEFYQTQYGLLKSRSLAERVAKNLKLVDDPLFYASFETKAPGAADTAGGVTRMAARDSDKRLNTAASILLGHVDIAPVRASRLVAISFTSPDPALSARVANAWGTHFIQSNLERRFEATSYARKFLEERLEQLRVRLEESERLLVSYAARERIITVTPSAANGANSPAAERSLAADDLSAINGELASATADRVKAESRAQAGAGGAVSEALNNPAIGVLRQRRAEVSAEYAKLLVQFEPGYPPAQALASQVAQLDSSIAREERRVRESLRTTYRESVVREQTLGAKVEGLKAGLLDLRRRSIQYNIYQREVDTNRQLYDGLLQRYKEIGVAGGVGTNNVSVVDPAMVPGAPSRPRLFLNLLISLIAGLGLGGLLAFAFEQIDETITEPREVESTLRYPLLGAVPKSDDPLIAIHDRKSSVVEAYLSIQTNLEFATAHGAPRSLSVTSTRPAEGKSTTSFALAHTFARAKRTVVLIDGDMRSPSIHGFFNLRNDKGLSNFLAGADAFEAMLLATDQENLFILPAGPSPPNAAELLTGDRLSELLVGLLKRFDHVIIDSPPVMGLADAPLIASKVEGTIYAVVSHGIRTSLVKVALARLRSANARIFGVVLTKFDAKRAHYGYGYDYGYGYGDAPRDAA